MSATKMIMSKLLEQKPAQPSPFFDIRSTLVNITVTAEKPLSADSYFVLPDGEFTSELAAKATRMQERLSEKAAEKAVEEQQQFEEELKAQKAVEEQIQLEEELANLKVWTNETLGRYEDELEALHKTLSGATSLSNKINNEIEDVVQQILGVLGNYAFTEDAQLPKEFSSLYDSIDFLIDRNFVDMDSNAIVLKLAEIENTINNIPEYQQPRPQVAKARPDYESAVKAAVKNGLVEDSSPTSKKNSSHSPSFWRELEKAKKTFKTILPNGKEKSHSDTDLTRRAVLSENDERENLWDLPEEGSSSSKYRPSTP